MKYFYEYKIKNGAKVGGHNLEKITIIDDVIILEGHDDIPTIVEEINDYWNLVINGKNKEDKNN